jgi:cbb3-type cytochrome oxidase subunit 3
LHTWCHLPQAPTNVNVIRTPQGYLNITWNANPPVENVTYYLVHRGTTRLFVADENSVIGQTIGTSFIDMDVAGSTYYFYKIVAVDNNDSKGPPSLPASGKGSLDLIVKDVTKWCVIGIIILSVFFYGYSWFIFDKEGYVISFDGNPTFNDDKLSGIINNTEVPSTATIYGINSTIQPLVYSSNLTNSNGDLVVHLRPNLTEMSKAAKIKSGNATLISFNINKKDITAGVFDGLLTIYDGELHSIPIRLATIRMLIQSIVIVGIGILISIILWEFIKSFRKNNYEQQRGYLLENARNSLRTAYRYQNSYQLMEVPRTKLEIEINELRTDFFRMSNYLNVAIANPNLLPSDVQETPNELDYAVTQLENELKSKVIQKNYMDKAIERSKTMETISRVAADTSKQAATEKAQKVENYNSRSLNRGTTYGKIIITEFGAASFGISVAIFGLLTNDYVLGLRNIGTLEVAALIGLGLGIGSLKEFVDN